MKLKNKFLLWGLAVNAILVFLLIKLAGSNRLLFVAGEILVIVSICISVWLYRGISRPLDLLSSGTATIRDKDFNTRLAPVGHPEMDDLIGVYNQMIDQLREERVRQQEKHFFLEKLIAASPAGIILLDTAGCLSSLNAAAAHMLGTEPVKGTRLKDIASPMAPELHALQNDIPAVLTLNGAKIFKCTKAHFSDLGYAHYFILIEEFTGEIYRKEKGAYEKVIRMMSHETNNSIGAINSILSTVSGYKDQLKELYREDYENALAIAIARNNALSAMMANFAQVIKVPEPVKQETSLHELLLSVQRLMSAGNQAGRISWKWALAGQDQQVLVDVSQMEQVLINILKNAIEAIGETGTIGIATTIAPASIRITDNGQGISNEISRQLFTPFFSSKKDGQGIGLMLTREILLNHRFGFSLETVGGLTTFTILL